MATLDDLVDKFNQEANDKRSDIAIKIAAFNKKLAAARKNLVSETDPIKKSTLQDSIDRLEQQVADLLKDDDDIIADAKNKIAQLKGQRQQQNNPPINKKFLSGGEVQEARNKIREAKNLPLLGKSSEEGTTNKLRQKLLKEQIKQIKSTSKPIISGPKVRFSLPRFAVENATGIVIVEIVGIILLQIHAASTFVTLWNYAFSPQSISKVVHTATSQVHGSSNNSLSSAIPSSIVPAHSGAGVMDSWEVPSEYSYSGGFNW